MGDIKQLISFIFYYFLLLENNYKEWKMIRHETHIDTVALQLDFDSAKAQRAKFDLLEQWIRNNRLGFLEINTNSLLQINKYNLLSSGRKILTMQSGSIRMKNKLTGELVERYYIRIRFAGLKSYNLRQDEASYNALMTICAWLNTTRTNFRLVELDVAVDIYSSFYNVLASCINKSPNVLYNRLGRIQYYNSTPTTYIENYKNTEQRKGAVLRAYLYNKSAKERLEFPITRFELKLQNRFFLRKEFNTKSIINALDRYYVMYFENKREKEQKIREYYKYEIVTAREIKRLRFESYRLYPNPDVITEFIRQIQSAYVAFNWDIVVPLRSNKFF